MNKTTTKSDKAAFRLLNRDGTFNVAHHVGARSAIRSDLFHWFLVIPWTGLVGVILGTYLVINLIFALLYLACGPGALGGSSIELTRLPVLARFFDCFFFSVQTFATIGYGKLVPNGFMPNLLVTGEALIGLLGVALATGLVFARFSRPTARVLFSNIAVINTHDAVPSFIFRMANLRRNQIVEAQISVVLSKREKTAEGEIYRTFSDLKLERSRNPIFIMSWTVVHPIDQESPLFGMSVDDLYEAEAEIVVALTGIDDAFSQTIHSRFSYTPDDILWNKTLEDITNRQSDGRIYLDIDKIHDVKRA